jgi:hypothetical protein
MDERSRPPRRGGPWAGRIPWGKTAVRITVGGITSPLTLSDDLGKRWYAQRLALDTWVENDPWP